ncbi:DTW domain-containing protein [Salinibius halmophilus]|uniref:DTW domain-containing protein n=1 Tax=Salinibius halmophilus TaxID=1853216 RepID=UPI000E66BADA|nr:tRNA-uridine aminocarboxypropyltransferase [Salinibius halmophilus]
MQHQLTAKRQMCQHCQRPLAICCCDVVMPFRCQTNITTLQDQRETNNKKNTLLLVKQCLPSMQVLHSVPTNLLNTGLVFPTPHSQPIESTEELPKQWLLLDGSWKQCNAWYLANPSLQALPSFHFSQAPASQYHIRKRPKADGLASIEAIAYLLSVVEPDCDWPRLNKVMATFNDRWLAQIPKELHHRYRR